jgi:hypothetical protein
MVGALDKVLAIWQILLVNFLEDVSTPELFLRDAQAIRKNLSCWYFQHP